MSAIESELINHYATTEQVDVALRLETCIQDVPFVFRPGRQLLWLPSFVAFPQFLQENGGIILWLRHDHFLTHPFQFILLRSLRYVFWRSDGVVKQTITLKIKKWGMSHGFAPFFNLGLREWAVYDLFCRLPHYISTAVSRKSVSSKTVARTPASATCVLT